jgi:hypothetical protein
MVSRHLAKGLLWGFLILGFAYGLHHLLELRFQAGDTYPPYSTLRTDPVGAKALYDGLRSLDTLTAVDRNHRPLNRLDSDRLTTFFLGVRLGDLAFASKEDLEDIERLALTGGQVVLALYPVNPDAFMSDLLDGPALDRDEDENEDSEKEPVQEEAPDPADKKGEKAGGKDSSKNQDGKKDADPAEKKDGAKKDTKDEKDKEDKESLMGRWGLDWDSDPDWGRLDAHYARSDQPGLPPRVSWHSALFFTELDPAWRTVYRRGPRPVMVARPWGKGRLIVAADSYLFSNEALRNERRPELLSWLVGSGTRVIFDETHFGLVDQEGVASLGRKYRLGGLLAGLLILAALYIWKNAFSLVPPKAEDLDEGGDVLTSPRDYNAGMVSLLRRNLSPRDLLAACYKAWQGSGAAKGPDLGDRPLRAEQASRDPAFQTDPVGGYRAIHRIIWEGRKPWTQKPSA